jgi:NDP-sugar pyrophosphorylase family protein
MRLVENFFSQLNGFEHHEIFAGVQNVWDPLKDIDQTLAGILGKYSANNTGSDLPPGIVSLDANAVGSKKLGRGIYIERAVELSESLSIGAFGIRIGVGTLLEPTVVIKSSTVIGEHCEVRQGAYIRGNVVVGNHSVIGHATEVKNSILMNHTHAGHFNYVGDSILGSRVNMGAGSRLANLEFRTAREKLDDIIRPINIKIELETVTTGLKKFGAVLGDDVELGCNAVLCPGVLVGKECWVAPNVTVPKGYYPPGTLFSPKARGKNL